MNVLNTLIWTLIYTSLIYRNNVVYCSDSSSGTPSTTPPSSPTSGTNESDKTASSESSNKKGVTLDIKNNKDSTDEFDHNKNGNVVTYTAKGDNAFNSVKHNGNEIWSTKNKDEYATKVILDGRGKQKKTVTIHLPGNKTKVYKKDGKDKPWSEDTSPPKPKSDSTSESLDQSKLQDLEADKHPSNVKLFTSDGTDTTKTKELENTKYKVKQDPNKTDIYVYEFNDGSNCTLVKCDDKDVWKYDSANNKDKYPKSINYNKKDSEFLVKIEQTVLKCKKENDNWSCVETQLTRTVVDLTYDTKECGTFEYKSESGTTTFTAKSGHGFYFVKDNGNEIWRTNDPTQYASKVEFKSGSPKTLTISLFNGSTKAFKNSGGLTWSEDTSGSGNKKGSGGTDQTGTTGTGGTGTGSPPSSGTTN